ncbi:MAG: cupin domain-containing protein [Nitrosopumilaceae archaeon]|uniref:Cupin domain-containing protein n=2 Tax=Candidatus Nitrosomaritimum aestuariumsis TaxID=3342354 RepID=A0AC60W0W6_9ARCH|nr:cupin domain-containing protein [Nitrosopumilaceae archaeon]MBA4462239.1 cupin domain-containing protein [Nitrosopumilaceae archaeon]MBA4462567.1 cupin domain-containing protein [Nitrosopumilaceae archaeon]
MSIQKNSEIPIIEGHEGTTVKQYFHPHNTINGIRFSLAEFTVKKGKKSLCHKLKSSEIYYILEGRGTLHIDKETFEVTKDDSVYVPPMSEQFIENTGQEDLRFLCIVDPAWKVEDEIILE